MKQLELAAGVESDTGRLQYQTVSGCVRHHPCDEH
jgi:hypothetical protein